MRAIASLVRGVACDAAVAGPPSSPTIPSLGAELFRRTSTAACEPSATGFNVGAIVNVTPHQNLLISAGRGLLHVETNRCSIFLPNQPELQCQP